MAASDCCPSPVPILGAATRIGIALPFSAPSTSFSAAAALGVLRARRRRSGMVAASVSARRGTCLGPPAGDLEQRTTGDPGSPVVNGVVGECLIEKPLTISMHSSPRRLQIGRYARRSRSIGLFSSVALSLPFGGFRWECRPCRDGSTLGRFLHIMFESPHGLTFESGRFWKKTFVGASARCGAKPGGKGPAGLKLQATLRRQQGCTASLYQLEKGPGG
jgi:hypothetical protein